MNIARYWQADGILDARRAAYSTLGSALAHLDEGGLRAIVARDAGGKRGWGASGPGSVGGVPVFVKRVPLTELEYGRSFSTRNHFRMPTFYNYGVGSAGFGAWRELVAHIKTTNWVLDGACPNFPLLLHWRVLHRKDDGGQPAVATTTDYLKRWNNSKTIASYMHARAAAPYELWLVLEHVPYVLWEWLPENTGRIDDVVNQMLATFDFLRAEGVVHFDAHFTNVVTDGETVYLTDYGLVNDARFDLTDTERTFLAGHTHYDYALFLAQLAGVVSRGWQAMSRERRKEVAALCGLVGGMSQTTMLGMILDHVDEVLERELMPIGPEMAATLVRHREVIVYMTEFVGAQYANPRKNTKYDDDLVREMLVRAGLSL